MVEFPDGTEEHVWLVYTRPEATIHTASKTVKRIVHYKTYGDNQTLLDDSKPEEITYTQTYFTDKQG